MTSRNPRARSLLASAVCPGGQGDVSVYKNLLFMSVEQVRGRLDCGTQRRADRGQHRAVPRRAHLRHQRSAQPAPGRGRSDLPRLAHAHAGADWRTIPTPSTSTAAARARCGRAKSSTGCSGAEPKDDPNTALFSIDVIEVRAGARRRTRRSSTVRASSPTQRPATSPGCGRAATTARARRRRRGPTSATTSPCSPRWVWRPVPARATASCWTSRTRCIRCGSMRRCDNELRLLALGDVQQRRHEDPLHRRVGRRLASTLPADRSAELGRRRHLRHRRSQAAVPRLLQDAGAADRSGELRRAQRLAHSGAGPRHHGAGVVSGRRLGVRLHRLGACRSKSRTSTAGRWTPSSCTPAATGRPTGTTATSTRAEIIRGLDVFRLKPSEFLSQNEITAAVLVRSENFNAAGSDADHLAGRIRSSPAPTSISSGAARASRRRARRPCAARSIGRTVFAAAMTRAPLKRRSSCTRWRLRSTAMPLPRPASMPGASARCRPR